ncbi:PKD domain-containing protein [Halocola ammonii]
MPKTLKNIWTLVLLLSVSAFATAQDFEVFPAEVNTNYDEYAPAMFGDKLIFCSNRKADLLNTVVDSSDTYMTNIFQSKVKDDFTLKSPKILSEWRRPEFHEGPTTWSAQEERFYFSSSMKARGKRKGDNRYPTVLGIYYVVMQEGDAFIRPRPFAFNSEGEFNVAHPAVSQDGERLVFVSDQSGSSDLYMCDKTRSGWSRPVRLPDYINTDGREMFPSFFEGRLYFASNGQEDSQGMDIYFSVMKDGNWQKPVRMKEPINSEFDDFGIAFVNDERGFFSSNRSGKSDDLFRFAPIDPTFENCKEIQQPTFCYLVEEQAMQPNDTLPIVYEWDLGDGTIKRGLKVEHCYADTGYYELSLNVRDTITGNVYTGVSELELLIEKENQPYITSADTVKAGEEVIFTTEGTSMTDFEIQKYFWSFPGTKKMLRTDSVSWKFKETGLHRIQLGVMSTMDDEGERKKSCVYKDVLVLEGEIEIEPEEMKLIPLDSVSTLEDFAAMISNNILLSIDSIALQLNDTSGIENLPFPADSTLRKYNNKLRDLLDVQFAGKDELTDKTKDDLNYLIMILRQHPQFGLQIESFYPASKDEEEDDISLYKALTIQNYFQYLGIDASRIKASALNTSKSRAATVSVDGFSKVQLCRVNKINDQENE